MQRQNLLVAACIAIFVSGCCHMHQRQEAFGPSGLHQDACGNLYGSVYQPTPLYPGDPVHRLASLRKKKKHHQDVIYAPTPYAMPAYAGAYPVIMPMSGPSGVSDCGCAAPVVAGCDVCQLSAAPAVQHAVPQRMPPHPVLQQPVPLPWQAAPGAPQFAPAYVPRQMMHQPAPMHTGGYPMPGPGSIADPSCIAPHSLMPMEPGCQAPGATANPTYNMPSQVWIEQNSTPPAAPAESRRMPVAEPTLNAPVPPAQEFQAPAYEEPAETSEDQTLAIPGVEDSGLIPSDDGQTTWNVPMEIIPAAHAATPRAVPLPGHRIVTREVHVLPAGE